MNQRERATAAITLCKGDAEGYEVGFPESR